MEHPNTDPESKTPRAGWDQAFAEMRKNNDDLLLDPDLFEDDAWD
jgi:hypothetical protein